jgi:predicted Zn-dependent peptidase
MIERTRLDNGLRIITERMPHVRSASVGVWIENGSRHEPDALNGASHFIEHAIFKGTERRSALDIAVESDRQGGNLNASTSQEQTCIYTRVLDEQLPDAVDLIGDMVANASFDESEIERERSVILEEIKMVEDTPDELVQDVFSESFWPDHPFGRPISGTVETVSAMTRDDLVGFYRASYRPERIVFAAAGNLEHDEVVRLVERALGAIEPSTARVDGTPPAPAPAFVLRQKGGLEQAHLVVGSPAPSVSSPDRYAANIMSSILGDGMSSRLFQRIREERGLVYGIYSAFEAYHDAGVHEICAGTSPENIPEVVELVVEELRELKANGPTDEELRCAKDQYKVSTVLSLESSFNRMSRLARHEICYGRQIPIDEVLERIEAVTSDDVVRVASEICRGDRLALTVLGDIDGVRIERDLLAAV